MVTLSKRWSQLSLCNYDDEKKVNNEIIFRCQLNYRSVTLRLSSIEGKNNSLGRKHKVCLQHAEWVDIKISFVKRILKILLMENPDKISYADCKCHCMLVEAKTGLKSWNGDIKVGLYEINSCNQSQLKQKSQWTNDLSILNVYVKNFINISLRLDVFKFMDSTVRSEV